jgi:hypothetical protein
MKYLVFIFIILCSLGCKDYKYSLADLESQRVKFMDIPEDVRKFYVDPSLFGKNNASLIDFVCLDKNSDFILETIETWYGPWIDYYKITDRFSDNSYRIDQGTPIPFVVHRKKLYIVDEFNIFTYTADYSKLEITVYDLK